MSENKPKNGVAKWVDSSVIIFFFAGTLLFLLLSGTLNSGYHFVDDHEMLVIHSDLEKSSVVDTTTDWIKKDLNIRFRPLYFIHRILEMKIFGDDFFVLSFYTGLLAALTFSFFYLGARKLKYSIFESLLFVLLTFIGSQMTVWWMLGPNETIGIFFLGLCFFFMAKCAYGKKYLLNSISFNILLVFASLSKESFVIIIPAFVFYKIWNEKKIFKITITESIRKNYFSIFSLFAMAAELWTIVFVVGTNKIGYAGSTSSIGELFRGIRGIVKSEVMLAGILKLLFFLCIIFLFFLVFSKFWKKIQIRRLFQGLSPSFVFSLLIVLPNILFYAKSGMVERYLLPTTFGISFLIINIIKNTNTKLLRAVMILVCLVFLVSSFDVAEKKSFAFAEEGRRTNELLSAVTKNADSTSKILLVADPVNRFEVSSSFKIYLSSKGLDKLYAYPMTREYQTDFERGLERGWRSWFENRTIENIGGDPDEIVIIDKNQSDKFFSESGISQSEYHNILDSNNPHAVYIKNNPS